MWLWKSLTKLIVRITFNPSLKHSVFLFDCNTLHCICSLRCVFNSCGCAFLIFYRFFKSHHSVPLWCQWKILSPTVTVLYTLLCFCPSRLSWFYLQAITLKSVYLATATGILWRLSYPRRWGHFLASLLDHAASHFLLYCLPCMSQIYEHHCLYLFNGPKLWWKPLWTLRVSPHCK